MDITLGEAIEAAASAHTPVVLGDSSFVDGVKALYQQDATFSEILAHPDEHSAFTVEDGVIYFTNYNGSRATCISTADRSIITQLLDDAHATVGHFGEQRTAEYLRRWFWW
ncbi:hypothetical protein CPC08DRAFT_650207, partial [Agrocybe pediades]